MNIVTSLCVDEDGQEASRYAQLLDMQAEQRRRVYWQCVVVFFASSVRCNPGARHLFFTNDQAPAGWRGLDYRAFLARIGVEIRLLPFTSFVPPPGFSTDFRNGFYKLEVLQALADPALGPSSVLFDSDCVWTRPVPELARRLETSNQLLLLDVQAGSTPDDQVAGLSRRAIGALYREIYPGYPAAVPTFFGGEVVGGSQATLAALLADLQATWQHLQRAYPAAPPRFSTQESIYDGDEYVMNLVYNRRPWPWLDASPYLRRIWTSHRYTNVLPTDAALPLWHLPSEKLQGLPVLCRQALNPASDFWRVPLAGFGTYLGRYLGLTAWAPQRLLALSTKLPRAWVLVKRLKRLVLQ